MTLGPPIRKPPPAQPEWVPVDGKPHFWRSTKTGFLEYRPPTPPVWFPVPDVVYVYGADWV